jgi:tRNA modification GTPase
VDRPRIVVVNKADRPAAIEMQGALCVSAARGDGLAALRQSIAPMLAGGEALRDTAAVSNLRHVGLLEEARVDLARARAAARQSVPEEILLVDLQAARGRFDEIVGVRTSEDVLRHIFERFCIGK